MINFKYTLPQEDLATTHDKQPLIAISKLSWFATICGIINQSLQLATTCGISNHL